MKTRETANNGNEEEMRAKWNLIVEIGDELILKKGFCPNRRDGLFGRFGVLNLSFLSVTFGGYNGSTVLLSWAAQF